MKKTISTIFCLTVVFYILPITAFSNDFSNRAISVFQEYKKANEEWSSAFLSGDSDLQKEKGKLLTAREKEYNKILKTLPKEYCAAPQTDLLREFIKTLIGTTDEYPTYVFAELYSCDPDRVTKEIQSLKPEDQIKIVENLSWGFKNIKYKVESLPNYQELVENLNKLKEKYNPYR